MNLEDNIAHGNGGIKDQKRFVKSFLKLKNLRRKFGYRTFCFLPSHKYFCLNRNIFIMILNIRMRMRMRMRIFKLILLNIFY